MSLEKESQQPDTKELGPDGENQQPTPAVGSEGRPGDDTQQVIQELKSKGKKERRQGLEARKPTSSSSYVESPLRRRYPVESAEQSPSTKQTDVEPLQGKTKIDSDDSEVWEAVCKAGARGSEPFPYEHPDMSTIRAEIKKRTGSAVLQDVEKNFEQQLDNFLKWFYFYLVKREKGERKQPIESKRQKKGNLIPAIAIIAFLLVIVLGTQFLQDRTPIPRDIDFNERMNGLRVMFSHQDPVLWSAITHDFGDEEMNKMSLLIIDTPSDQSAAQAFALALSWLFAREHFQLNPSQFTSLDKAHAKLVVEDVLSTLGGNSNSLVVVNSAENMPMYVIDSLRGFCSSLPIERSIVLTATPAVPLPGCGKKTILRVQPETAWQLLPSSIHPTDDYHTALDAIREVFGSQSARMWQATEAVLTEHRADGPPRKPAILVIGAPPGAHRTADLLAEALAKIYSGQPLMVDSHQFSHVDADRAKLHIDRTLDSTFSGDVRSAVFTRVDSLPSAAAMIFHSYCDHDDAQFKNAAYFMTVHCSDDVDPNASPKAQEEVILDYLKRSWSDLHEEKRGPLLSRIASMVAVVKAEENIEVIPTVHT